MYWLDTVILLCVGIAAVWGAFAGLIWQVSRVVTVILGLYCTIAFNGLTTPLVQQHLMQDAPSWMAHTVAYVLVFLAVWVVLLLLTMKLEKVVEKTQLQWLNRSLGAVLGGLKAGLLIGIVLYGLSYFSAPRETIEKSTFAPVLTTGIEKASHLIPEEYREKAQTGLDDASKKMKTIQNPTNMTLDK